MPQTSGSFVGTHCRMGLGCLLVAAILAIASGCGSEPTGLTLDVRVFVDRNGNNAWDPEDVGIEGVRVELDRLRVQTCDAEGCAVFSDLSGTDHTVAIPPNEIDRLAERGLTIEEPIRTLRIDASDHVDFEAIPVGFLHVEVQPGQEGNRELGTETPSND